MINISLIGTGRLSFNLMNEILDNKSLSLNQIYGRSKFRPKNISDQIEYIKEIKNLKKSDFYFIAVSDIEIETISNKINSYDGIVIHLSGSTNINVLSIHKNHGVFYPLQTFSYDSNLSFKQIPILIEANSKINLSKIKKLADIFSKKVYKMNSSKRLVCHISATIANNFSNHMIVSAEKILEENKINKSIIKPLIFETFNKLNKMSAKDAQTGPALRNDYITIEKHVKQLVNSDFLDLYKEVTKNIKSNEL
ncbi:MAG: DUF2520 domain-containing protein [Cryomorphaceae bacterium]|nr:MAG: DUF2520 domain-containing protein [Cryomorphaceae bacterium]